MSPEREQLLDQNYSLQSIESHPDFYGKGLRHCIIVGENSDIAKELKTRLEKDGWTVNGTGRDYILPTSRWDLLIVCQGTMRPIGKFFECNEDEWTSAIFVNALWPLRVLRQVWGNRNYGAKVVFMSGPNPTVDTPTYTAYRAGKAVLQSLVGTLNAENPDAKFIWFIPGVVKTKIHYETLLAGDRAGNLQKAKDIMDGTYPSRTHDDVYKRLCESL